MYFVGYIIYAVTIAAILLIPSVRDIVVVSFELATEIVIGCGVMSLYPLLLFFTYNVRGKRDLTSKVKFESMAGACGNIVVSLGLIGTFVGLTKMIEQIAGAVTGGGDGGVEEQIAGIMIAIGNSLNSMSFAFLTSVMGVAASVIVLLSASYFKQYFDSEYGDSEGGNSTSDTTVDEEALNSLVADNKKTKQFINKLVNNAVDRQEMASIIVSNTIQIKELGSIATKLFDVSKEQSLVITEHQKKLTATEDALQKQIELNEKNNVIVQTMSEALVEISKTNESILKVNEENTQRAAYVDAKNEKIKQAILENI